jgi:hypothetical protein
MKKLLRSANEGTLRGKYGGKRRAEALNEVVLNRKFEVSMSFRGGPYVLDQGIVRDLVFSGGLIGHGYLAV